jgi:predicted MPP superfamily phosphohydrolase
MVLLGAPILIGLAGAWLGLLAGGRAEMTTGPFRLELSAGFGHGDTDIALPPFGRVTADTHLPPLRLTATLRDVDVPRLTDLVRTSTPDDVVAMLERDTLRRVPPYAVRLLAVSLTGAFSLGLLAFRLAWRRVGIAVLTAGLAVGASELGAWWTYDPTAFLSPRFSGSLSLAPNLVGPVRTATDRIDQFREELRRVVEGAIGVFTSIQARPLLEGGEIRVLHISDIHLSPLGLEFARQVSEAFDVDFVIDTGDLTSFGTPAEELIVSYVPRFARPYVFVRGNHDSAGLEAAMRDVSNAVVLDGDATEIDGISVYGLGDPTFTPNPETAPDNEEARDLFDSAGDRILLDLSEMAETPDIVAVHNDRIAAAAAGLVPLVIAGHDHVPSARMAGGTLFLRAGTTGGAGATVFTEEGGIPLSAQILRFIVSEGLDSNSPGGAELVAWDLIEQSPETGSLVVERHLVAEEFGALEPSPSPSPSLPLPPTGTGVPTGTGAPAVGGP